MIRFLKLSMILRMAQRCNKAKLKTGYYIGFFVRITLFPRFYHINSYPLLPRLEAGDAPGERPPPYRVFERKSVAG